MAIVLTWLKSVFYSDPYSAEADRAVGKAARGTSAWRDAREAAFYAAAVKKALRPDDDEKQP